MADVLGKAIDGLRNCSGSESCIRCPYRGAGCADRMMEDALRMLEAFRSRIEAGKQEEAPKRIKRHKDHKPARPVLMLDKDGRVLYEFESAKEAHERIGVNPHSVRYACREERHTAGGFRWMYKEEQ